MYEFAYRPQRMLFGRRPAKVRPPCSVNDLEFFAATINLVNTVSDLFDSITFNEYPAKSKLRFELPESPWLRTAGVFLDTLSALAYKEIKKNGEFVLPGFGKLRSSVPFEWSHGWWSFWTGGVSVLTYPVLDHGGHPLCQAEAWNFCFGGSLSFRHSLTQFNRLFRHQFLDKTEIPVLLGDKIIGVLQMGQQTLETTANGTRCHSMASLNRSSRGYSRSLLLLSLPLLSSG